MEDFDSLIGLELLSLRIHRNGAIENFERERPTFGQPIPVNLNSALLFKRQRLDYIGTISCAHNENIDGIVSLKVRRAYFANQSFRSDRRILHRVKKLPPVVLVLSTAISQN